MSSDYPITRLEHIGQDQITASDTGIEARRSFYVEPWDAYSEVAEILLGRPDANTNGTLKYPPHTHPVHQNLRCVRCEIAPTPQDVSYASGKGATSTVYSPTVTRTSPFTITYDADGNLDMTNGQNAINHRPYFQAAIITAYYAQRPDWLVERTFNGEMQTLPQQYLQWANITQGGSSVSLSPFGPSSPGTPATKRSYNIDIVITPFRHPKAPLQNPIFTTWGNLVGRINGSNWDMSLKSNLNNKEVVQTIRFPAETLLFQGLMPRIQTSSNATAPGRGTAPASLPGAPFRQIAYDYWDHSFRFTFKGTQALVGEFAGTPTEYIPPVGSIYDGSGRGYYTGWNRFLALPDPNTDAPYTNKAVWDYAVTKDGKYAYETAEGVSLGATSGFDLLFNW